ncbi:hypothetical protein [Streptococcus agalactiae]|uniref:hypothetical protein n=1 Tax=Streptococcus agalactiae TaxID=1311 RepID=UPI000402452D
MNIEEAKKLIDKQSIGKGGVGDIPVVKTHIVKVLLDQLIQPKPECHGLWLIGTRSIKIA